MDRNPEVLHPDNDRPKLRAANLAYEDIHIAPGHRIIGYVVTIQKEPPSLSMYREFLVNKTDMDKQ